MGLTRRTLIGSSTLQDAFAIDKNPQQIMVALAGNPNTGKSTVFNALTGLNQHTGNWPGKTVLQAQGRYRYKDDEFLLVDLPGTYSLQTNSIEEQIARDFICFANPDATIIIADATCLERNLNLALQIMEITPRVIVCVNLLDEAQRKQIKIDLERLEKELGVPVVGTVARSGQGLKRLQEKVYQLSHRELIPKPVLTVYDEEIEKKISQIEGLLADFDLGSLPHRWLALRLLDQDTTILRGIEKYLKIDLINPSEVGNRWTAM